MHGKRTVSEEFFTLTVDGSQEFLYSDFELGEQPRPPRKVDTTMFLIADMLFRRSKSRARREEDAPVARPRTKSGRSPRARLREDAISLLR